MATNPFGKLKPLSTNSNQFLTGNLKLPQASGPIPSNNVPGTGFSSSYTADFQKKYGFNPFQNSPQPQATQTQQPAVNQSQPKQDTTGGGFAGGNGGFGLNNIAPQNNTLTADQVQSMINQGLASSGQDPFKLSQQPNDRLNQLLDTIQKQLENPQQNNSLSTLQAAQDKFGVSNLLTQYQQQGNAIADKNNQYSQADASLKEQPMLLPQLVGHEANLEQRRQADIANLTGQQQSTATALNAAQGFTEQALTAQGQNNTQQLGLAGLGLQAGGLGIQQAMLPAQQQLAQAQANQAQAQAGFYQNIYGGLNGGASGGTTGTQGDINSLPSFLQGATTTDMNGQGYIVDSRVPGLNGLGADAAKSYAGRLGIPILNDAQAGSITALDTTQNNLKDLQSKIGTLLGSGLAGRLQGLTLNNIEKTLGIGNGPSLTQIDSFRESAIKQIQGLASGNSGLRLNQSEIDSAIKNLPTSSDNIETANAKMQQLSVFFTNQRAAIYALGGLKSSFHAISNTGSYSW